MWLFIIATNPAPIVKFENSPLVITCEILTATSTMYITALRCVHALRVPSSSAGGCQELANNNQYSKQSHETVIPAPCRVVTASHLLNIVESIDILFVGNLV